MEVEQYDLHNQLLKRIYRDFSPLNIVARLKPLNLKEEKEKFFRLNGKYNPQFRYCKESDNEIADYSTFNELIKKMNFPDDSAGELLKAKAASILQKNTLTRLSAFPEDFTNLSIKIFGRPSQESIEVAEKILRKAEEQSDSNKMRLISNEPLPFSKILKSINNSISQNGFAVGVNVVDEKNVSRNVSVGLGSLTISKYYEADSDELADLVAHEIDTHLRRSHNGRMQKFKLLGIGTANFIKTEEGLAPLMGHIARQNKLLLHPSLLTISIQKALQSNFAETYQYLQNYTDTKIEAWTYTLRAKRGIEDTSMPGAFTKDLYLMWAISVGRKLISKPELVRYAFNGKGTLEELKAYTSADPRSDKLIKIEDIQKLFVTNEIDY